MVEEDAVHGFPDLIVAPESEGEIADSAGGFRSGKIFFYPTYRADEIYSVGGVFGNAGPHRENVAVENHFFRPYAPG